MGYARKDVEKTKKIAKKFVRYQEGAYLRDCSRINCKTASLGIRHVDLPILIPFNSSLSKKSHCVFMDNELIMNA